MLPSMRDAKDQKMDLIICASISRFARNFSDCMTQIAALKTMHPAHPIGVYFETENIYTLNPSSQYSLDIGYQGSAVLDESEREADTTSVPMPRGEEFENIPLPDLPEQPVNMQQASYELDERGMPT